MRVSPAAAAVVALLLTACGSDSTGRQAGNAAPAASIPSATDTAQPRTTLHDATDVWFAQEMISHHRQAVEMSELAEGRAAGPEVADLARRIRAAQEPEIRLLTGWLREWGEDVPPDGAADGGHGGHGAAPGSGMMTPEQMAQLEGSTGSEFDRLFLTLMIEHHRGAVAMSRQEVAEGRSRPARELATRIVDDQQREIEEMAGLLAGVPSPSGRR